MKSFVVARQIVFRMFKSSRMMRAGHVAHMGEKISIYNTLDGNPEGKCQFRRPTNRWKFNIRMSLIGKRMGGSGLGSSGAG
jgi:hypothetical protein